MRPAFRGRLFSTTGDAGMRLAAPTVEGLFAGAAEIVAAALCDRRTVRGKRIVDVALPPADTDHLLVAWINEIIYLFEVRRFLVRGCLAGGLGLGGLTASLAGEEYDGRRHRVGTPFKAAALHRLSVARVGGVWRATVILDV
jgi:SHS2 domain-containing protein